MKKTVLIPGDFSVQTLQVMVAVLDQNDQNYAYDFVLLHNYHLSNSITDLLFYSKYKIMRSLMKKDFEEARMVVKNKFDHSINSMRLDIFFGNSQLDFDQFLESFNIEEIWMSEEEFLRNKFGFGKYIKKTKLDIHQRIIKFSEERQTSSEFNLMQLFAEKQTVV